MLNLLRILAEQPDDERAVDAIGIGSALNDHQFCMDYDTPTEEAFELRIVHALRPLTG